MSSLRDFAFEAENYNFVQGIFGGGDYSLMFNIIPGAHAFLIRDSTLEEH